MTLDLKPFFPIFTHHPKLVYLDTAATSHKPASVTNRISSFYEREYATVHRGVYSLSIAATDAYTVARERLKQFFHSSQGELIFTRGTTASLNLVAFGFAASLLQPNDCILITSIEHHSNLLCWQEVCRRCLATLVIIPYEDLFSIEKISSYFTPAVKLFSFPHISNVLGYTFPVQELVALAHAKGIYTCIDGAQAVGHFSIDLDAIQPDFYAFSAHKMYGPTGIGALYIDRSVIDRVSPIEYGGDMVASLGSPPLWQPPPLRFEAGTPMIAEAIGWHAAIDFLESVGMDEIHEHESLIMNALLHVLTNIPSSMQCSLLYPGDALVSFYFHQYHPYDLATLLDLEHIALRSGSLCSQNTLSLFSLSHVLRASIGVYNSLHDIERFEDALYKAYHMLAGVP